MVTTWIWATVGSTNPDRRFELDEELNLVVYNGDRPPARGRVRGRWVA
jgi:hypothetical protein